MKNKKNQKSHKKPIIILVSVAILVAIGVFCSLFFTSKSDNDISSDINYDPPTQEEITAGENIKQDNESKNEQHITDYSIFIVDASQYDREVEVRSYVEGIIKDDGTCTFTFSKGSAQVVKTSRSFADAKHTNCGTLTVPISEFSAPGIWSLLVSFSFDNITVDSSNYNVEITK